MTNISLIISGLRGGGAERVCVTLANGLAERGYQVDVVVLNLREAVRDKDISVKAKLVNLDVAHARYSALELWKYLHSANPEIVLSFNSQISVVLSLIRRFTGQDFRLISRNINFLSISESSKKGLWHGLVSNVLIKKFYALSDVMIAQSHAMKDDMATYLGFPKEKIIVINNPVSQIIHTFSVNNDIGEINKQNYLLCVGRLEEQKAFHYAIDAFTVISSDYPGLRLKIVGQGSLEETLKKKAAALNLADRIDFEGYQTDIIYYYLHAKATMLTSLYEGFPNVLVESIALGTPIISFDCHSGPREIIIQGKNGYLVNNRDVNDFSIKLKILLEKNIDPLVVKSTASRFLAEKIISAYESVF